MEWYTASMFYRFLCLVILFISVSSFASPSMAAFNCKDLFLQRPFPNQVTLSQELHQLELSWKTEVGIRIDLAMRTPDYRTFKISEKELAKQTGIPYPSFFKIFRGLQGIQIEQAERIAKVLGKETGHILAIDFLQRFNQDQFYVELRDFKHDDTRDLKDLRDVYAWIEFNNFEINSPTNP